MNKYHLRVLSDNAEAVDPVIEAETFIIAEGAYQFINDSDPKINRIINALQFHRKRYILEMKYRYYI